MIPSHELKKAQCMQHPSRSLRQMTNPSSLSGTGEMGMLIVLSTHLCGSFGRLIIRNGSTPLEAQTGAVDAARRVASESGTNGKSSLP